MNEGKLMIEEASEYNKEKICLKLNEITCTITYNIILGTFHTCIVIFFTLDKIPSETYSH